MSFSVEFGKSSIKSNFDWQLCHEVNVVTTDGKVIAKAELELLTLNRHRDALKSYQLLDESEEGDDWEVLLNIFFKGHNVNAETAEALAVKAEPKKAQTHMMIEAISVHPEFRQQGVARLLLKSIAEQYTKVQSISLLSLPMNLFVDADECETEENAAYYQSLNLSDQSLSAETLSTCFAQLGFNAVTVEESVLNAPLPYQMFMASPAQLK